MSFETQHAALEAPSHVLNPDHFLFFGSKHVEGFLRVFRILGLYVVSHLNRQVRHRDRRRKELRRHVRSREGTHLQQLQVDEFLILGDSLQLRKCLEDGRFINLGATLVQLDKAAWSPLGSF
jgi:hypothetical protein